MAKKVKEEAFSYCIGRTWDEYPYIPKSNICVYSYHETIHYGTMDDALALKKFIEKEDKGIKYNIYKLVKVEE